MPAWGQFQRFLVAVHLYLGLVLCLFFAVWFVTGIVMMYYTWPDFRQVERQALAETIPWDRMTIDPATATAAAGWDHLPLAQARIGAVLGRPVMRALPRGEHWRAIHLDDGSEVSLSGEDAQKVAEHVSPGKWALTDFEWEGSSMQAGYAGGLKDYDRVHFFTAGDGTGRQLVVSAATGEPLLLAGRFFPLAFVAGPGLHYFMIKGIRQHDAFWHDLMHTSATLATIASLTGLTLGLLFFRWKAVLHNPRRALPYVNGWMWWHHALGLLFGFVTLTWSISGFLSFNPIGYFSFGVDAKGIERFRGGTLAAAEFQHIKALSSVAPQAREVDLAVFENQAHGRVWNGGPKPTRWSLGAEGIWTPAKRLGAERVQTALQRLYPGVTLSKLDLLESGDAYYYERAEKRRWKSFPVYRATLEGSTATTMYLEPATGEIFLTQSAGSKMRRWLYQGLHSFDYTPFVVRPFWDVLMITLLLGGFSLSVSGVVLSWRWLAKRFSAPVGFDTTTPTPFFRLDRRRGRFVNPACLHDERGPND